MNNKRPVSLLYLPSTQVTNSIDRHSPPSLERGSKCPAGNTANHETECATWKYRPGYTRPQVWNRKLIKTSTCLLSADSESESKTRRQSALALTDRLPQLSACSRWLLYSRDVPGPSINSRDIKIFRFTIAKPCTIRSKEHSDGANRFG